MKKLLTIIALVFFMAQAQAQYNDVLGASGVFTEVVTIGSDSIDVSALVDMTSTTKGILVPQMTTTQRNAIANPKHSLLLYNLTDTVLQYNSGTSAVPVWRSYYIDAENGLTKVGVSKVKLGGFLTESTTIDGTVNNKHLTIQCSDASAPNLISSAVFDGRYGITSTNGTQVVQMQSDIDNGSAWFSYSTGGTKHGSYAFNHEYPYIAMQDGVQNVKLDIGTTAAGIMLTDNRTVAEGLVYGSTIDNYTDSTLIDKRFADANYGASNIYTADGTLTGNRTVTMGANSLTFDGNNTIVKGLNDLSSHYVFKAQNSSGSDLLTVRNDGQIDVLNNTLHFNSAQFLNTRGSQLFIGENAGENAGTLFAGGSGSNVVVGRNSLKSISAASVVSNTTVIGDNSMPLATLSSNNTSVGGSSLSTLTTGSQNTSVGSDALKLISNGNYNVAFGYGAGKKLLTNSSKNISIGAYVYGFETLSVTHDNTIAIGYAARSSRDNEIVFGSRHAKMDGLYFNGRYGMTATQFHISIMGISAGGNAYDLPAVIDGNAAAGTIYIDGAKGTGTGSCGSVVIATAPSGITGSTQNALINALEVDGNKTAGETRLLLYDIDKGTLVRVSVGTADSGGVGRKALTVPN